MDKQKRPISAVGAFFHYNPRQKEGRNRPFSAFCVWMFFEGNGSAMTRQSVHIGIGLHLDGYFGDELGYFLQMK